ncbi:MAG: hypothetical protein J7L37_07690 [Thermococcus sp.]|nr:hypothetical protein [Thermococcus sp.]
MGWKRFLALALVLLFLGMTVSGASAAASLVNATGNTTATLQEESNLKRKIGDDVRPMIAQTIPVLIGIMVGDTELAALTVSLFVLAASGLRKVIEKYGGEVADTVLKAAGFKQLSEFVDGFIGVAGYSMSQPKVEVHLKKLWFIPLPIAEKVVIKDGSTTVVEIKKSELDQINDLFTPKEFGQLLGQAYLNGWDANKAKKFEIELYQETRKLPKFKGRDAPCGYWPPGRVRFRENYIRHLSRRHVEHEVFYGEFDATPFPESISGEWLADVIKKAILKGEVNCRQSNLREVALEVNTELGRVRVILRIAKYDRRRSLYDIITAYLVK